MIEIKCVIDAKAQLGESPYWDPCCGVLWWVDIFGRLIRRYDPINATEDVFDAPEPLGLPLCPQERWLSCHDEEWFLLLRSWIPDF